MQLSRHNAEIIVKELNTIINDKINMMNEKGVIIASTDQERIEMCIRDRAVTASKVLFNFPYLSKYFVAFSCTGICGSRGIVISSPV